MTNDKKCVKSTLDKHEELMNCVGSSDQGHGLTFSHINCRGKKTTWDLACVLIVYFSVLSSVLSNSHHL